MGLLLVPQPINYEAVRNKEARLQQQQKKIHDCRHKAKELPELAPGDTVYIRTEKKTGTIYAIHSPRSYIVDVGYAKIRRNRKHLVLIKNPIKQGNEQHSQRDVDLEFQPVVAPEENEVEHVVAPEENEVEPVVAPEENENGVGTSKYGRQYKQPKRFGH